MAVIEDVISRYERDDYPNDIGRRCREVVDTAFQQDDEGEARLIVANALADMGPWLLRLVNEAAYSMPGDQWAQMAEGFVNHVALSIVAGHLEVDRDDWTEARAALAVWHARRLRSASHLCWASDAVESLPQGHPWRDVALARSYLEEAEQVATTTGEPADRGICIFTRLALRELGDDEPADLGREMAELVDALPEDIRRAAHHGVVQALLAQEERGGRGELQFIDAMSNPAVRTSLHAIASDPYARPSELALVGALLDLGGDEDSAESCFREAVARAKPRPDLPTATYLVDFLRLLWRRHELTELTMVAESVQEVLKVAYHDAVEEVAASELGSSYWHAVALGALALLDLGEPQTAAAAVDAAAGVRYLRDAAIRQSGHRARVGELGRALQAIDRGGAPEVVPESGDLLSETYSLESRLRMEWRRLVSASTPAPRAGGSPDPVITLTDLLGRMLLAYYPDGRSLAPTRTAVLEPGQWCSPFPDSRWLDVYDGNLHADDDAALDEFVGALDPVAAAVSDLADDIPVDQRIWLEPHFGLSLTPWWVCTPLAGRDTRVTLSHRLPRRPSAVPPRLKDGGRALIVSDPFGDLPAARLEGQQVADLLTTAGWHVDLLEGSQASRANVLRRANGARLLHFAGHAAPKPWDPGSTSLLLEREIDEDPFPSLLKRIDEWHHAAQAGAPGSLRYGDVDGRRIIERWVDARLVERQLVDDHQTLLVRYAATGQVEWWADALSARDLGNRDEFLDCELAFLSACGSSASDVNRYQHEPGGLAAAMLLAGARTVVGALWPIGDVEALVFSQCFYDQLRGEVRDIHLLTRSTRERLRAMSGADASAALAAVARFAPTLESVQALKAEADRLRAEREPFAHTRQYAAFHALSF